MSAVTDARVALDLDRRRLDPVDAVDRGVDQREAVGAPTPRPCPRFCHGSPATTSSTRSRPSCARASAATTTCPTCTGSNVPPNTPSRSTVAVIGRESTGAPCLHLGETFASSRPVRIDPVSDASEPATHVLVRVWLPDRPGALGLVASRIGAVDGDIVGIDVLERGDDVAVDEFAVLLRKSIALDLLVREIEEVDGASVEEVRTSTTSPTRASTRSSRRRRLCAAEQRRRRCTETLVEQIRAEFLADWSALLVDGAVLASAGEVTPRRVGARGAGRRHRGVADGRRRHHRARRPRGRRRCPTHDAALLVGRDGHPFRRRERAQLVALAGIADRTWALLD